MSKRLIPELLKADMALKAPTHLPKSARGNGDLLSIKLPRIETILQSDVRPIPRNIGAKTKATQQLP